MATAIMEERATRLAAVARDIRFNVIDMVFKAQSGHISPGLGAADIMATLFFDTMHLDPQHPEMEDRDRFVLSKGHSCPVLYATLALRGYFPVEELKTLRQMGSRLQGHPGYTNAYTEKVDQWVAAHKLKPSAALLKAPIRKVP